ncbi:ABC transporter substrate-binding protein [Cohnella sp. REN36]|uniref:ABC transporter substrate-binding protein n=1 Tax=Cohnella sp. REN36 TaxID=2887347 RepID=UPI001D14680C|nr:extracellular solute-binding protein [Cohnella sp. REN36]MCC3372010.1 extracellular solute-binding protein [Cohnella sp. REN36]
MTKARWLGLGATALSLVLVITACGANSNDSKGSANSPSHSKAGSAVQLGITWAGSQVRHDATLAALDLYSKSNPDVTFEPTYMGFDTYFTKLATLSASRNLPDIMQIDTGNLMDYALRNQLADLSGGIDTSNMNEKLLSAGKVNGKLYGIPLGVNTITFMYNKAAFDKLGIQVPEKGFNWDEWVKIAKETKPKLEKGKYFMMDLSMATGTTESDKYEIYQLAYGKGFIHTPDGKFNIDRDTYIQFNKLFADLRNEGIVPPANVTAGHKQNDPQLDLFMNGTILVQREYAAAFPNFESVHPGQFAMTLVPSASNAGGFMLPSQFFTVSQNSKYPDEARKFIEWFVNDKEAGRALTLARGVPVSKPVLDDLSQTLDATAQMQIDIIDRVATDANSFSSRPKGYGAWTDEWTKISQAVAFDKMAPEKAYDELKKKWDEIIKL